jgi:rare lipoprotein A (peptidoglycan hydrolase)
MAPPLGFQLASNIYEYNLQTKTEVKFSEQFWFSIKYDDSDYFRKNIYYYDELKAKWVGLPSLIINGSSKIVSHFTLPYAKLAILEDISIMTEGTASWYKYKGCDCAASPDYPKGTKLKVTNLDNNKEVIVKVNDWGPERSIHPDRVIDLDIVAFKKIAKKSQGLCRVKVELFNNVNVSVKK